jgi:malate dehydrogenase (oxaloacetate-decarboxylating)
MWGICAPSQRPSQEAVYRAAVDEGVATKKHDDVVQTILDAMWVPEYK